MKKVFALTLAFAMVFSICGCKSTKDNGSEVSTIVEYEEITIDPNGNIIESSQQTTTSQEDAVSKDDTNTQSDKPTSSENKTSSEEKPVSSENKTSSEEKPASSENKTSSEEKPTSSEQDTSSEESSSTPTTPTVKIDYDTVVEVDICDDIVRGYLDANTPERQFAMLNEYSGNKSDYQELPLTWNIDFSSEYTIYISENADFSNSQIIKTSTFVVRTSLCIPGRTYYWKVIGTKSKDPLGGGKVKIKDAPVRWLTIDGTANVRDMGGWKTDSGKTVKYGMLYRGQKLDSVTKNGILTIKELGLKTELDMRYSSQRFQLEGTGMNYNFLETNAQYDRIFSEDYKTEVMANYKKIFSLVSDKSNYPFYAHCSAGADRTGTYAFILNGVLGVPYEDLTRDFELTSFSQSGKRWRGQGISNTFFKDDIVMQEDSNNYVAWGKLHKTMMEYGAENGCTTLKDSIECFLIKYVGVPQEQIDAFRSIMLE